ncbi:uncharacterized protein LOC117187963 [Drosophila miranda]|uniref:uncharacterized protein LOC117187963 n=1 Tax=Drosophila miranda TaxID=7229 RepID=UPI0007E6B602|nr:uncharacterized protein LOC117187963 [Drosophila miranda]
MFLLKNTTRRATTVMQDLCKPTPSLFSACNAIRKLDTLYGGEGCEDCVDSYPVLSVRKDLKRMEPPDTARVPEACWQSLRRTEYKCRTDPEFTVDSFITERMKCLADRCAFAFPRRDLKYYRPGDKLRRKYQRTWVECVLKRRKRKAKCILKPINIKRRMRRKPKSSTVCKMVPCNAGAPKLDLMTCTKSMGGPCPKITMPFCKAVHGSTRCKIGARGPGNCRKRLTKYPSFSECLIDPLPEAPPTECNCLQRPSMCSVWEYYRNRKS